MDMQEILKKVRTLSEGLDECNMTAEGEMCPEHGIMECPGYMEEAGGHKPDADGDGIPDWADKHPHAAGGSEDRKVSEDDESADSTGSDGDDRGVDDDGEDLSPEAEKALDDGYYNAIKGGGKVPEEVVEPDRFIRYYEQKYGKPDEVSEGVNISLDGAEAEEFIHRLSVLAGQPEDMPMQHIEPDHVDHMHDTCDDCGMPADQCECGHDHMGHMHDTCDDCGMPADQCECGHDHMTSATWGPDGLTVDENAEHDFGHEEHSDVGEPVDPQEYMWKPLNPEQRFGKMGDNTMAEATLVKEDANSLYAKLRKDYRTYVAEADLAASNAPGADSPLTATDRDEFEKDPFASEEPVTDGSRSPLSTIKRQSVAK